MPESPQWQDRTSGADSVRLRTVTGRTILRLKSWASGLAHSCPKIRVAGLDLPRRVGAIGAGELRALCTGPSDWLLIAPGPLSLPARSAIEADSVRQCLALVDLSSGSSAFEISGRDSRAILRKGCGLDLDPQVFAPGNCARTRFAQIPVVIDFVADPNRFELYVGRSNFAWLKGWLEDAAIEFQHAIDRISHRCLKP